jgi:predicted dehydrogenase
MASELVNSGRSGVMNQVRIGIIGIGGMGSGHTGYLKNGEVPGAVLAAVCDINPARLEWAQANLPPTVKRFDRAEALIASGEVDAVLIATPHYEHPPLTIAALKAGLHVLSEKPAGVYTKQVREANEVAAKSDKVFGIMFNQRTNPVYQKYRELVQSGELGELKRTNWIITNWFRSQSYYDSGGWRATWRGEGGGVLLNQCPHNLDLWQWICGMPVRVRAFAGFGKYHDIEVEDDVTAYVEYENGATGVFITSTADAPGTNRLEVTGDRGKIVLEDGKLTFWRTRQSVTEFLKTYKGGFGAPECWKCEIPVHGQSPEHKGLTTNWVNAILKGTPLLGPGVEGIRSLTLSNAMLLSAWTNSTVELPIDEEAFHAQLQQRIATSRYQKAAPGGRTLDTKGSYNS